MKKSTAIKQLLRAPLKTILTFLLIAAASFALFSRVMDYTVTTREIGNAKSFYHGVAALDNTVPDVMLSAEVGDNTGVGYMYESENKPWPAKEQLKEFTSLPGVALTDKRYMTAGLIENYQRLIDTDNSYSTDDYVLEGTYSGYEDASGTGDYIFLKFDDVKILAGNIKYEQGETLKIQASALEDYVYWKNPYPRAYWEKLDQGSRCLVLGNYDSLNGGGLELNISQDGEKCIRVLNGLPSDYLETEEFAFYKKTIEMYKQNLNIYDIVYTADMRAIPRFNERKIVMSKGRLLTNKDKNGCVVSELFLQENHLSIGDKINVQLGNELERQNAGRGAREYDIKYMPSFVEEAELEIIGAYKFTDTYEMRVTENAWSYTINTVFVPDSLLPIEIPADYETDIGEFSVFIEDAGDIQAFLEASEPLITKMEVNMRFSDGGWTKIKDSFDTGARTAFFTMALYVIGAALALLLAVYLYVGRNKKTYAVMRTLGVPVRRAQNSVVLPLVVLAVFAIPIGGAAGLSYAKGTVFRALEGMMKSAPFGYVPNAELSSSMILLCLFLELVFTSFITLVFLWKMKNTSPLELLQGDTLRAGAGKKAASNSAASASVPERIEIAKLPSADEMPSRGKYGAFRQVFAYILRHMRRSTGKTAVSFLLAIVLTAGVGLFVMAQLTYEDTFHEIDVEGKAMGYASSCVDQIAKSHLIRDLYYRGSFGVRINGGEITSTMLFTNDLDRYLSEHTAKYKVAYAQGYDASSLNGSGSLCVIGKKAAEANDIQLGGKVPLLSDTMYSSMHTNFEHDPEVLQTRLAYATKPYTVIGIIDTEDAEIGESIFSSANFAAESLYSQAFQIEYCEFFLADNTRADSVERFLEDLKAGDYFYGSTASFYLDTEALRNISRICDLLKQVFPIAVAAAAMIGIFGPGLVIMQSANEAAFLRVLGVTKKRSRCMLVFEQALLCAGGMLLVAAGLALYHQGRFLRGLETLAHCGALYFLASICGAFLSSILVTRHNVLELLHTKE